MSNTNQNYKPILFSTEMVQALLEGRKTQTRRIMKHNMHSAVMVYASEKQRDTSVFVLRNASIKIGDILWVRETWQCADFEEDWDDEDIRYKICYTYKASNDLRPSGVSVEDHHGNWVNTTQERFENSLEKVEAEEVEGRDVWYPSIHMPKEAARIFLKVVKVRGEKLQDVSEEDAKQEGSVRGSFISGPNIIKKDFQLEQNVHGTYKDGFKYIWSLINGVESWNKNPWVWVYEFEQIEKPEGWLL